MTSIFISYAKDDREVARLLADALKSEGYDIWWDRQIPAGVSFETYIELRLNEATCALVIWSQNSVDSMWVRAEANEALAQKKLVPVLIDDSQPPLVFRQIQTADLRGWNGDSTEPRFSKLVDDIKELIGPPEPPGGPPITTAVPTSSEESTAGARETTTGETIASTSGTEDRGKRTETGGHNRRWRRVTVAMIVLLLGIMGVTGLTLFLQAPAPPAITRFEARPSRIAPGSQTELVWEVQDADVVTLLPDRRVEANGSLPVRPGATTRYSLTADNSGGSTTRSIQVVVQTSARIHEFTAVPDKVVAGAKAVLRWRTENVTRVQIDGKPVKTSDSAAVAPSKTTVYRLTATGEPGDSVEQLTTVTVTPARAPRIWLVLSGGGGPLKDSRVRDALAFGVGWRHMLNRLMPGRKVVPAFEIPIDSRRIALTKYSYDREKAKQLLAEAGYPDGLAVYLYVDNDKMKEFGNLLVGYLARAGVIADLSVVARSVARSRADKSHKRSAGKPVLFLDLERR